VTLIFAKGHAHSYSAESILAQDNGAEGIAVTWDNADIVLAPSETSASKSSGHRVGLFERRFANRHALRLGHASFSSALFDTSHIMSPKGRLRKLRRISPPPGALQPLRLETVVLSGAQSSEPMTSITDRRLWDDQRGGRQGDRFEGVDSRLALGATFVMGFSCHEPG